MKQLFLVIEKLLSTVCTYARQSQIFKINNTGTACKVNSKMMYANHSYAIFLPLSLFALPTCI